MTVRLLEGDCLVEIPKLVSEGIIVDSVCCDPPYHLLPTAKRFGPGQAAAKAGKDGSYQRLSGGFMNQTWDGGDIAFRPETWATISTVLRPGGFLLAFGGTRTFHRLVCAIEDAGFVIQDTIAWLFGSGFPKRRDMLKPAWESICIARKPFALRDNLCELKNSLAQMVTSRCGMATITALSTASSWLDTLDAFSDPENMSIIGTELKTIIDWKTLNFCLSKITPESIILAHNPGHLSIAHASPAIRFFDAELAKLKITLAPSVAGLAISREPIELLAAAGVEIEPICVAYKPGGKRTLQVDECRISCDDKTPFPVGATSADGSITTGLHSKPRGDDGAPMGRWPANCVHDGSDEVMEAFDAFGAHQGFSGGGRREGLIGKPGVVAPLVSFYRGQDNSGTPYSDTGSVARFFYCAKAGTGDRWGSRHPTVKPGELLKWLVPLVTPPGGTFLDPFAGSGTAAIAAMATGRNAILIEREASYCADIRERLAHYEGNGRHSVAAKARNRSKQEQTGTLL